ncbi:MAG: hypothetical protein FD155_6 [Bacteroidetes bacterium]|nr:MAG: hypothetical protein FD155_6 [Bacteroidota bacterium]
MNLPFYIAKRYLLAKKSHNLINIISAISVAGVGVGAFALIVVLSVFNGFEKVIGTMIDTTTPDLLIEPTAGKWIDMDSSALQELSGMKGVRGVVEVIEEDALFRYREKQHIGRIKAVGNNFQDLKVLDSLIVEGEALLSTEGVNQAVAGIGVAWYLGFQAGANFDLLQVYVPRRGNPGSFSIDQGFNVESIRVGGIFSSQQDFDGQIVYVPLAFARQLLELENKSSAVEVYLHQGADAKKIKQKIVSVTANNFTVKNRYEQQETLFNIMKSEKWAIFIILTFILFMATFNVIGSLTMLIVDKKKDTQILRQLGASPPVIRRLFLFEGLLISTAGGIIGLGLGIILVWIQEVFGVIGLGDGSGAFVIDAYPVDLQLMDVFVVLITVLVIGGFASFMTVKWLVKKLV